MASSGFEKNKSAKEKQNNDVKTYTPQSWHGRWAGGWHSLHSENKCLLSAGWRTESQSEGENMKPIRQSWDISGGVAVTGICSAVDKTLLSSIVNSLKNFEADRDFFILKT